MFHKNTKEIPLSGPIEEVMTKNPKTIRPEKLAAEAMNIFKSHKIDQLVVVDDEQKVVGLLDVQDLIEIKL